MKTEALLLITLALSLMPLNAQDKGPGKDADPAKPMATALPLRQLAFSIPKVQFTDTSLAEILDFMKMRYDDFPHGRPKIDTSLIQDRLGKRGIAMEGKDLSWAMVLCLAADAVDCDLLFGRSVVKFIPREP